MSSWRHFGLSFLSYQSYLSVSTLVNTTQFLSFQSNDQLDAHWEGLNGEMVWIPLRNYSTEIPPWSSTAIDLTEYTALNPRYNCYVPDKLLTTS